MRQFVLAMAILATTIVAQMEKRNDMLYDRAAFLLAEPALGTMAPDLCLQDLDGRLWSLEQMRGRTVVLIKGGFT